MKLAQHSILALSLILFSCSDALIEQEENASLPTIKAPPPTNCGTKIQVGNADNDYNCFGFAFSVSETGDQDWIENNDAYTTFISSGLFKEDNSSKASKVLYWNNLTDYNNRAYQGITHAAMILSGSGNDRMVRSKQGATPLYENCIDHYYLGGTFYYRTYALNADLSSTINTPERGDTFTLSTPFNGQSYGVSYNWNFDTNRISLVRLNGYQGTFKVKSNAAAGTVSITISATHQTSPTGNNNNSYPKTVSDSFSFYLQPTSPPPTPLTGSFNGSSVISPTSMGVWNASASGGTPGYFYTWWIKRSDGTGGAAYQISTGSHLVLSTTTTIGRPKYTYYDLYMKVYDSASPSAFFTTPIKVISSTGPLVSPF